MSVPMPNVTTGDIDFGQKSSSGDISIGGKYFGPTGFNVKDKTVRTLAITAAVVLSVYFITRKKKGGR